MALLGDSDGGLLREGLRQFLHGTITPLSDIVGGQIAEVWEGGAPTFNFDRLFASDISGRARAFGTMVTAGMDIAKAAALSGLITDDN